MVYWLRLCTSSAGGEGSVSGWGKKIPHAMQYGKKKNNLKNVFKQEKHFRDLEMEQ